MTAASSSAVRQADERARDSTADGEHSESTAWAASPAMPGLMDFIGADVGGELAEERWR
jgi:hypothetical protein